MMSGSEILQKSADNYQPLGHLDPQGFRDNITFTTFPAPADLVPFVNHFWTISWERTGKQPYISEQLLHQPFVDVFISNDEAGVQCTFRNKKEYRAEGRGRIIGARLHPGAFHAFWHWSMSNLHDQNIALERVFPEVTQMFQDTILSQPDDEALASLAELLRSKNPQPDSNIELVSSILAIIEEEHLQTVSSVAKRIAKSERWLQQLFQEYVGVGIKWVLQRNKLIEAASVIREKGSPNWAALAYDLGYSSQQHFISDFKKVTGWTPRQYKIQINQSSLN